MSGANKPTVKRLKSFILSLLLFAVIFTSTLSISMWPKDVSAQDTAAGAGKASTAVGPGFPVTETGSLPAAVSSIWDTIIEILETIGKILYKNALDYFVQRVAYDTATFLATGSSGQKPLYWDQGVGGYLAGVANEAVGGALDDMAKETFGVSLCEPRNATVKLNLILSAKRTFEPKRAVCTFNEIVKSKLINVVGPGNQKVDLRKLSNDDFSQLAQYFRPESNELGASFQLQSNIKVRQAKDTEIAELQRQLEPEIQGLKTTIGKLGFKETLTPAVNIKEWLGVTTQKSLEGSLFTLTGDIVADAVGTFVNTFASKYLKKLQQGLLAGKGGQTGGGPGDYNAGSSFGTRGAQALYADFITPSFRGGGQIEILSQLVSCPPDAKSRLYNNCIIDTNLSTAIDQKLTVREAIERGYLDLNKPFGFLSDGSEPDYKNGYPYRSLVFLRKYRIIPVTWELAALYIKDISGSSQLTLADVIGRPENDFAVFNDVNSPFYHLIDPNWVLKIPQYECNIEGPGPQVLARVQQNIELPDGVGGIVENKVDVIQRANYCADERSCIVENPDGSCNQYGYCTNERDIWRFSGDSCQPSQATCETYVNSGGQRQSYLAATLDSCDFSQVGCRWYSAYQTVAGDWAEDIWDEVNGTFGSDGLITFGDVFNRSDLGGLSYARHFNKKVESCSSADDGCQKFLELTDIAPPEGYGGDTQSIYQYVQANSDLYADATYWGSYGEWGRIQEKYLKQAPAYLNCPTDVNDPDRDPECDNYAQSCTPEDVGCALYTPLNGDPPVPGVLQPNDYCSEQCVGYDQYLEQPTYFELLADPAASGIVSDLIPDTANSCRAQAVGCERFTNLDKVEQGGEGIEYYTYLRECISPNDPSAKVFYTWEGSDTTGYQLKTWRLQDSGGPVGDPCTPAPDNLACRTFIDVSGSTYDRDINTVVFATEDCHPLRRELDGSIVYGIESLSNTCRAADVGCHEYRGNSGNVVTIVINDDFESGTNEGWRGGTNSNESIYVGGHSLATGGNQILKRVDSLVQKNKAYTLSFWARSSGSASLAWEIQAYQKNTAVKNDFLPDLIHSAQAQVSTDLLNPIPGTEISFGTAQVPQEWQYFQIGPMYFDRAPYPYEFLQTNGADVYIDNIILREITDSYYLIKDSWETPAVCNQPFAGAQLGCQSYSTQSGENVNLLGFSSLCSDNVVGCKALIDTQNSDSPFAQDFNTDNNATVDPLGLDDVTVPADNLVYLVDDPKKYCSAAKVGCELLGQAVLDRQTDAVIGFSDNYLVDNPEKYQTTLCQAEALYCEEYINERTQARKYFVDPGQRLCEYRTAAGSSQLGWYRQGTDIPCDLNKVCSNDLSVSCSVDADCSPGICINSIPYQPVYGDSAFYNGWVGSCSEEAKGCSQYIDPEGEKFCTNNPTQSCVVDADCTDGGLCRPEMINQSYYYLEQSVDSAACNGIVDREKGCRLFNKTDGSPVAYTANAWPASLVEDGQTPLPAADPALNDSNIIVKVEKDRTCDEWLYCRTRIESYDSEGNRDDKCFDIGLCDALDEKGECVGFPDLATSTDGSVAEVVGQQELGADNYTAPYTVEDLRTMSGYTKAGMTWSGGFSKEGTVPGYLPYSAMVQVGSAADIIKNSSFEKTQTPNSSLESPFVDWSSDSSSCGSGSICAINSYKQPVDGLLAANLTVEGSANSTLKLSQDLFLSPSEYILSGYVRWNSINESAGLQIEVKEGGTALKTFSNNGQEYSNGWTRFSLRFSNTDSNIQLVLSLIGAQNGDAYFDGLEILPALQVTNDPSQVLLGQSCRLYPKSDSPECNYFKAGKSYLGWPGFCVESDPRNPAYCVNWWPVDATAGSLSQLNETPLIFGEKVPLYYCVEAAGRKSSNPNYLNYSHNNYKYSVSRETTIFSIKNERIAGNDWYIENGGCSDTSGLSSNSYALGGCSRGGNIFPGPRLGVFDIPASLEGSLYEYEMEKIKLVKKSTRGEFPDVVELTPANRMNASEAAIAMGSWVTSYIGQNQYVWGTSCSYQPTVGGYSGQSIDKPVNGACSNSADQLMFAVVFSEQGQPMKYLLVMDDYSGDKVEAAGWDIQYYLRDSCLTVVKVADVEENGQITAVPYWSRVNALSGYQLRLPPPDPPAPATEYYTYDTDSNPFGSSYQSGLSDYASNVGGGLQDERDPATWDSRPFEQGNQPLYVEAANTATINDSANNYGPNIRAGTPFACNGTCDSSVCVGGPNEGNACNSDQAAKACYVGDGLQETGVCVGSWQASGNVNGKDASWGKDRLRSLFAKSLQSWTWQYNADIGQWQYMINSDLNWNDTGSGSDPVISFYQIEDQDPPYYMASPQTVKLTFTSNINNDQLPLRHYTVKWGDGSPDTVVSGYFDERPSPSDPHVLYHTYSTVGNYNITIEVEDNWGQVGTRTFQAISDSAPPPAAQ